jgi:hypothetical protein
MSRRSTACFGTMAAAVIGVLVISEVNAAFENKGSICTVIDCDICFTATKPDGPMCEGGENVQCPSNRTCWVCKNPQNDETEILTCKQTSNPGDQCNQTGAEYTDKCSVAMWMCLQNPSNHCKPVGGDCDFSNCSCDGDDFDCPAAFRSIPKCTT